MAGAVADGACPAVLLESSAHLAGARPPDCRCQAARPWQTRRRRSTSAKATMAYSEQALLKQCHPVFKPRLEAILVGLRRKGWKPKIAELVRTSEQQKKKVATGVSKTLKSWHVPSTIGLLANGASAVDVVHGNAADIVDERYGWSGLAARH